MKRTGTNKGMTLIEVLLGMAIVIVIMIMVWNIYMMGNRFFNQTQRKLTAVQGALLLVDRLSKEIPQSVFKADEGPEIPEAKELMVSIFDEASALSENETKPAVATERVAFRHNKDTGELTHSIGGEEKAFNVAYFEELSFYYGADAFRKKYPSGIVQPKFEYIKYRIICASSPDFENNKGKSALDMTREMKNVVSLFGAVGLHQKASLTKFPYWNAPYPVHD